MSSPFWTLIGGREDADVRMLGEGRPFVLEIMQPMRGHPGPEQLAQIEATLAGSEQ